MKRVNILLAFGIVGALFIPSLTLASTITASQLVTLSGTSDNNRFGRSVVAGDFTGDGIQDVVSGAPYTTTTTYLAIVPGSATEFTSFTVASSNSVVINGASTTDSFGENLAVGDINNDGLDDLVVSAGADTDGGTIAGAIYILYGRSGGFSSGAVALLASAPKITGSSGQGLGASVATGDMNGDGYDDIAVGAARDGSNGTQAGAVHIMYGSATPISSGSITAYTKFYGEAAGDNFGASVAVGDLNGDGYDDIAAGSPGNDDNGTLSGSTYVIYGKSSSFTGTNPISTQPELVGETTGNSAGRTVAITRQNLAGDTYNDLLIGAPGNDDGATDAGSVYVVPGSSTSLSSSTNLSLDSTGYLQLTGEAESDEVGMALWSEDMNQDGLADVLVGGDEASSSTGLAYLVPGSTSLASGSLSTGTKFTGTSASDTFGKSIYAGDINADGFPDLLVGAITYSAGGNTGAVYVGYLYIDNDVDGVPGMSGVLASGADCNDSDGTVSSNQIYYVDADGDGNGSDTSAEFCASTAPEGYSSNSNDTDDTIPNAGVEIDGDAVDNDGDGEVDEWNTLEENGEHPYFSTLDPAENNSATILLVAGGKRGKVRVTYADNSVYSYKVFSTSTTDKTTVEQYKQKGYALALHQRGKKLKLLNLLTGEIADSLDLVANKQTNEDLLLDDVRQDGKIEAIVSTKLNNTFRIFLIRVKKNKGSLSLLDKTSLKAKNVKVKKTKVKGNFIVLRNASGKTLERVKVNSSYEFVTN